MFISNHSSKTIYIAQLNQRQSAETCREQETVNQETTQ